jgi:Flp pilus assembly protein TadG
MNMNSTPITPSRSGYCRRSACLRALRGERGTDLVEFGLVLPFLCIVLVGAVDLGVGYYKSIEVSNAAYVGALFGTQNSTDITGMQNAAVQDAANVGGMTATAVYGCVCSQSTSSTTGVASCTTPPTCSGSGNMVVNYVQVTTSATYKPLFPWPGLPSSFALQGTATLRAGQ